MDRKSINVISTIQSSKLALVLNMENQGERLKELIARFVLKYNYWGYLFSRIRRVPVSYGQLGSVMSVSPQKDGTITLFFEPDLLSKTDDKEILKVIEHEGMHVLNKHIPRLLRIVANEVTAKGKHRKLYAFNCAADCSVNTQMNLREPIIVAGESWPPQLPELYGLPENQTTEYYYLEILEQKKKEDKKNGQGADNKGSGSPIDGSNAFNDHDQWKKGVDGVADLNSLSRKIDQHIVNIVKDSVKHFNKDRGNIPGHIAQLIEAALLPPKAPYYQIIRKLVRGTRISKFKRTPTRINRKRTYAFTIDSDSIIPQISPFPGKTRDTTFNIIVMIDTSGSMSDDDVREGLSGVKNIIEKDRHCFTTVLEVDAGVEKEYEVNRVKDIQFDIKGRGGTRLFPGLERAKELNCDVCLAFTDGYVEDINAISRKYLPKKIIWVITKNGQADHVNRTGYVVKL